MTAVNVCAACAKEYTAAEWEALPLVGPAERDVEDLEVRACSACGSHMALEVGRVFRASSRPRITIPSPPPSPGARRDLCVVSLHAAQHRLADLVAYHSKRANLDASSRLAAQVAAVLGPVLTVVEFLIPEAPTP